MANLWLLAMSLFRAVGTLYANALCGSAWSGSGKRKERESFLYLFRPYLFDLSVWVFMVGKVPTFPLAQREAIWTLKVVSR